jgi:hypothetical protein
MQEESNQRFPSLQRLTKTNLLLLDGDKFYWNKDQRDSLKQSESMISH